MPGFTLERWEATSETMGRLPCADRISARLRRLRLTFCQLFIADEVGRWERADAVASSSGGIVLFERGVQLISSDNMLDSVSLMLTASECCQEAATGLSSSSSRRECQGSKGGIACRSSHASSRLRTLDGLRRRFMLSVFSEFPSASTSSCCRVQSESRTVFFCY